MIITHEGKIVTLDGQPLELGTGVLPTPSVTPTMTPTPSITPTITPTQTITPTISPTQSITPTITPTPSITPTITPTQTITPTPTPTSGATSALRLLILGDTQVSTVSGQVSNEIVTLGYPTPTISAVTISTTYSGTGLSSSSWDVVLYYTNSSQTGAVALNTSLRNYVDNGGNLVTCTFIWNLRPLGFDFTLTPYVGTVNQSSDGTGNMTVSVVHPITNGVGTSLTGGNAIPNNLVTTLQSGATTIATYTSSGYPIVGINVVGTSRLVGINGYFVTSLSTRANLRRLVTNAILWGGKVLN
jgi:hypothetical protein